MKDKNKLKEYMRRYRENMTPEQKEKERERWRKYRQEHKHTRVYVYDSKKAKAYYEANKDRIRETTKKNAAQWRNQFLEMYGNVCECCGIDVREFLTLDHILGQKGSPQKENGVTSYRKACSQYQPQTYRILCMNCNFATRNGDVCPHKK